jgi:hypothetical protein
MPSKRRSRGIERPEHVRGLERIEEPRNRFPVRTCCLLKALLQVAMDTPSPGWERTKVARHSRLREMKRIFTDDSREPEQVEAPSLPHAERIAALSRHRDADSVLYQSLAVAAIQVLERVLDRERRVAEATISLAQREKLQAMISGLESAITALKAGLNAQGDKMLALSTPSRPATTDEETNWWFAVTEAMQALEDGADWISSIVNGQPRGSAARTLSSIIARLLYRHYKELLEEADQWMGNLT